MHVVPEDVAVISFQKKVYSVHDAGDKHFRADEP